MRAHRAVRAAPLLALGLLLSRAGTARADSLNLRYIPSYTYARATSTDAEGVTTRTTSQLFPQRFILTLDKSIYPALTWSGSGLLDWNKSWIEDENARWTNTDARRWIGNTRLELGTELLRTSVGYSRAQTDSDVTQSGVTTHGHGPITESYTLAALWRPADLPTANLSATRTDSYDVTRTQLDQTTNDVSLALDYAGFRKWQLHYGYQFIDALDHVREGETVTHTHAARVTWGDQYLGGRLSTFATYGVGTTATRTESGTAGAVRQTQRLPLAGLSRVEVFPDVPARVTLQANPALVDSVTTGGAGIDLGSGRTTAGDTAYRDLGAQFPEDRLDLNTILVYVDRPLSDAVAEAFTWEAWVGDDNLNWTRVQIVGTPVFSLLQNRFEITIDRTRARYVKVVTRPLGQAVTTEPQYAEILVTELQFSLVEPLPPGVTRTTDVSGTLTAGLRYVLLPEPNLTYDVAFALTHHDPPFRTRESLQQTLGLTKKVGAHSQVAARYVRTDAREDAGHFGQNNWGASVNSEPIPTFGWNLNYSGGYADNPTGTERTNGVNGGVRADLYENVSSNANIAYRYGDASGRHTQAATAAAGLTATPHRALTATGSFGWAFNDAWGAGGSLSSRSGRIDGSIAFNPVPALYLAVAAGRYILGARPATQTSVNAGVALFHGGGLSLRFNYSETNDQLQETWGRNWGAGLTWTILRGRSLTVMFNHLETTSPVQRYDVDSVFATLQIPAF